MLRLREVCLEGLQFNPLPAKHQCRDPIVPHAPSFTAKLNPAEFKQAIKNSLRYFPKSVHKELALEFSQELKNYGHIYMYRFMPRNFEMKAYPLEFYPANCLEGSAIIAMIMNNLDPKVAQFPHELITYGGNGQVFSNWAQFRLVLSYLCKLTKDQTLILYSGHPLGLFPSSPSAPRLSITNGMIVPNFSSRPEFDKLKALGCTMYGQMTAGSFCYIGPQGIVHGTTLTLLNAGRKYLKSDDLSGKVYLTSGLGGMSGAQAKAAVICGCIGLIAEVSMEALEKRKNQGWLDLICDDLDDLVIKIREERRKKSHGISIGFHGNVVQVWQRFVEEFEETGDLLADLASDQTSLHNPFGGGYYPVQVEYEEANRLIKSDPVRFEELVKESLRIQVDAINKLAAAGLFFWDYGNAFLLEAHKAGADLVLKEDLGHVEFKYPSYVQHIMGDIFSLGFGPFRWVCMSQKPADLELTDQIAARTFEKILEAKNLPETVRANYSDNLKWIKAAGAHKLVVGSQARILYSDQVGRLSLALAFNQAVRKGLLSGPVVLSRDHHDVSGADSPFRETSNIYDGSNITADMATQNFVGDAFRGATWVALHNGGGVGWGNAINGGFGLLLDGSEESAEKARKVLNWDVSNGVARRAWAGNGFACETIRRSMQIDDRLVVTLPYAVCDEVVKDLH